MTGKVGMSGRKRDGGSHVTEEGDACQRAYDTPDVREVPTDCGKRVIYCVTRFHPSKSRQLSYKYHIWSLLVALLVPVYATPEAFAQSTDSNDLPSFVARDDGSILSCADLPSRFADLGPGSVVDGDEGRWIVYEDRVSRQPLRAVAVLAEGLEDDLDLCGIDGMQAQRFGLSLPAFSFNGDVMSLSDGPSLQRGARGVQVDLEVELLYNFAIDYPVDWFRDRIAIGPKLKVWWPSGVMFAAQYAIPIRNQIPNPHADYWDKPYPNVLMGGFRKQLTRNWIGAASAGLYDRNRYGWDTQLYWISDRWPIVIGGRAGMSGYWSFFEGEFQSGPLKYFNGYLDGTIFLPWYNIRLRGRTGQFVREINHFRPGEDVKRNLGTSGEVTRMFGEVEIGLHLFYDGFYVFPGFRFAVPLSPRKGLNRGRLSVYPTRQHYVPYDLGRVVRGEITGFIRPDRGEIHRTDVDVWPELRMLAPWMMPNFR